MCLCCFAYCFSSLSFQRQDAFQRSYILMILRWCLVLLQQWPASTMEWRSPPILFPSFFFSFVVVIPAYRMDNNEAPSARYHPSSSFFWEGIISIRLFILAKLSFSSRMSHRRNAADRQSQLLIIQNFKRKHNSLEKSYLCTGATGYSVRLYHIYATSFLNLYF